MGRLHRFPYHPYKLGVQGVEVRLVPELGREGFQGLSSVVLPSVETAVYKALDATSKGHEQSRYDERGNDYSQLGLLLLACEGAEDSLGRSHASEVNQRQRARERSVDEGTVYEEVYVVETVSQDGDASGHGEQG